MRPTHSLRVTLTLVITSVVVSGLAACTPGTPGVDSSAGSSGTATPTESSEATPTPSASPTVEAAPFVIDCNSIIPQSRRDWLASSGWTAIAPADFFAKVRSEVPSSPYILMQDNGGIVCAYSSGFEVVVAYGYAPLAESQHGEAEALIGGTNDNYVSSTYAGGALWDSATEGNAFEFFLLVPGEMYVATTTEILDEMLATVP